MDNLYRDLCYVSIGITCNNIGGLVGVIVGTMTAISIGIDIYYKIKNKGK